MQVAGFEKNPVEVIYLVPDRVLADHMLLRRQQQRARDRLADLARDRQVGIAPVKAIMQRVALLALAELPLIGNERRLRQGRAGPKPAKRKHRESKNRRAQRPNTPL